MSRHVCFIQMVQERRFPVNYIKEDSQMSAKVLDCKLVAQSIKDECKAAADALKAQGITPK